MNIRNSRPPPGLSGWFFARAFTKDLASIELPVLSSVEALFSLRPSDERWGFPAAWHVPAERSYGAPKEPDLLIQQLVRSSRIEAEVPLLAVNSTDGGRSGGGPDMDTFVENSIRPPGYRWETPNDQMTALESIREHFKKESIAMVYRSWDQRLFFAAGNCTHRFGCAYKYEAKFRPSPPTLLNAEISIKEIDLEVLQKLEKGWAIFAVDKIIQNRIWEVLEKHKVPLSHSGAVFHEHIEGAAPLVIQKDPSNPWVAYTIAILSEQKPSQCFDVLERVRAIAQKQQPLNRFLRRGDGFSALCDDNAWRASLK